MALNCTLRGGKPTEVWANKEQATTSPIKGEMVALKGNTQVLYTGVTPAVFHQILCSVGGLELAKQAPNLLCASTHSLY